MNIFLDSHSRKLLLFHSHAIPRILMNGGSVKKKIRQELTYRDLDSDIDNLWSILFTTGYLTQRGKEENDVTESVIPNREIQWISEGQMQD